MICKRCNHTYPDSEDSCPVCGEPRPVETEAASGTAVSYEAPGGYTADTSTRLQPAALPAAPGDRKGGTTPLILGILSLMIPYVGIVLGILAIVFGSGAKKTNPQGPADYALGHAGFVLGIIGLAFQAFLVVYVAVVFGMVLNIVDSMNSYNDFTPWMYYAH